MHVYLSPVCSRWLLADLAVSDAFRQLLAEAGFDDDTCNNHILQLERVGFAREEEEDIDALIAEYEKVLVYVGNQQLLRTLRVIATARLRDLQTFWMLRGEPGSTYARRNHAMCVSLRIFVETTTLEATPKALSALAFARRQAALPRLPAMWHLTLGVKSEEAHD